MIARCRFGEAVPVFSIWCQLAKVLREESMYDDVKATDAPLTTSDCFLTSVRI